MKTIVLLMTLLALATSKASLMDRLTAQLAELTQKNLSSKESPPGTPCDELPAPQPKFQECSLLTGRVGKMQGLKNTGPQSGPITIVSKNIYAELHLKELRLFADQNKVQQLESHGLTELRRIVIPKSFQQEDSRVNCMQLDFQQKKCEQTVVVDREIMEPEDNLELGLCFDTTERMDQWVNAIVEFRDGCHEVKAAQEAHQADMKHTEKVLNEMAGLDMVTIMENQVNSLVKQAQIVQTSLINLEKNKKHYQDKFDAVQITDTGLSKQMLQDSVENKQTGHPENCDKPERKEKDPQMSHDQESCKKSQDLHEVTSAQDIDYSDIDQDEDLSAKGKKKKREDRLAQWQAIQDARVPKRMKREVKITEEQMAPVKTLLNQLIEMQQSKKKRV